MITSINENYKFYTDKEDFYFRHRKESLGKYSITLYNMNNVPVYKFTNIREVSSFDIEEYLLRSIRVINDFISGMYSKDRENLKNILFL